MFEITNNEEIFRLSYVERLIDLDERSLDKINCWLEIKNPYMALQCQCEVFAFDLKNLRDSLDVFYQSLSNSATPAPLSFTTFVPAFSCEINAVDESHHIEFKFKATPNEGESWQLSGEMVINQSYFPELINGIESMLAN